MRYPSLVQCDNMHTCAEVSTCELWTLSDAAARIFTKFDVRAGFYNVRKVMNQNSIQNVLWHL
jgi:hypothetical protein